MITHLNRDISSYLESIGEDAPVEQPKKKVKTRDRIIELLRDNPKHTTRTLAEEIGINENMKIIGGDGVLLADGSFRVLNEIAECRGWILCTPLFRDNEI